MEDKVKYFMSKLKKIPSFMRVKFVILFGSQASGKANPMSDYDFAIYFEGNKRERFDFLLQANFSEKFDAKIFQDLPLYIRKEVLKGKVVYAKDLTFVYDTAYETIKALDDFQIYCYDYFGMERMK